MKYIQATRTLPRSGWHHVKDFFALVAATIIFIVIIAYWIFAGERVPE